MRKSWGRSGTVRCKRHVERNDTERNNHGVATRLGATEKRICQQRDHKQMHLGWQWPNVALDCFVCRVYVWTSAQEERRVYGRAGQLTSCEERAIAMLTFAPR